MNKQNTTPKKKVRVYRELFVNEITTHVYHVPADLNLDEAYDLVYEGKGKRPVCTEAEPGDYYFGGTVKPKRGRTDRKRRE